MKPLLLSGAIAMALSLPGLAEASCGAAFCTINTSWDAHGAWLEPGGRLDLRYEYIQQDRRRGSGTTDHDEIKTINRNLLGTYDYTFNRDWGVNVLVPLVNRFHRHTEVATGEDETWRFNALGDVRVMLRRRLGSTENHDSGEMAMSGVNFGLKLPTGKTGIVNPEGERAERTLQPGSGTPDALLGASYMQHLPMRDLSWFVQGLAQVPLNSRDDYKPGKRFTVDLGVRHELGERFAVLMQLNALQRGRDTGGQAEPDNTGGLFLFASPGLSYAFSRQLQLYGFVQVPIHEQIRGVQLVPRYAVAVGLNTRF
jgi:hypothetical protein